MNFITTPRKAFYENKIKINGQICPVQCMYKIIANTGYRISVNISLADSNSLHIYPMKCVNNIKLKINGISN